MIVHAINEEQSLYSVPIIWTVPLPTKLYGSRFTPSPTVCVYEGTIILVASKPIGFPFPGGVINVTHVNYML